MPPRILVIRRRYLGDLVLLGSFFANLRARWPDARLAALVEAPYAPVLGMNPDVNETFTFPRRAVDWPGFLGRIRAQRFTHVLDLDNTEKTAAVARLSGAPIRARLEAQGIRPRLSFFYNRRGYVTTAQYLAQSIVDTNLALLGAIDVPVVERRIRLVPSAADVAAARQLVPPSPGGRVLIHPGSRSTWRQWPAENFAQVADRLQDELDTQVFVAGGPGDQAFVAAIKQHAKSHLVTLPAALGIPQFTALAAQFPVMLCHDSGPMHLAAAVGTRVVALYGSQDATVWRPHGNGHIVLQAPLPCSDCVAPTQCKPGDSYRSYCVRRLQPSTVFDALRRTLLSRDT